MQSWLRELSAVLLRRHVYKTNPAEDDFKPLQVNLHHAWVHYRNAKETTISVKHLASTEKPVNVDSANPPNSQFSNYPVVLSSLFLKDTPVCPQESSDTAPTTYLLNGNSTSNPVLRRSKHMIYLPDRLN